MTGFVERFAQSGVKLWIICTSRIIIFDKQDFEPYDRAHRSHSRHVSLGTLAPLSPCSAVSTVVKTLINRFHLGCKLFARIPKGRAQRAQVVRFQPHLATLSQSERKNSVHRSVPSFFGPGDEKSREGLFATRGGVGDDCSAFAIRRHPAPCYAIFRLKGGMDPAPLLTFNIGLEALAQTMQVQTTECNAERARRA